MEWKPLLFKLLIILYYINYSVTHLRRLKILYLFCGRSGHKINMNGSVLLGNNLGERDIKEAAEEIKCTG